MTIHLCLECGQPVEGKRLHDICRRRRNARANGSKNSDTTKRAYNRPERQTNVKPYDIMHSSTERSIELINRILAGEAIYTA